MAQKSFKYMKKRPIQDRSKATVAAILEATAQLLQETTPDTLTTAEISERAGVSVGSIYQYFETKEALIAALAHDTVAQVNTSVRDMLMQARPDDLKAVLAPIIDTLLENYHEQPARMGFLISHLVSRGEIEAVEQPLQQLEAWLTDFLVSTGTVHENVAEVRVRIVVQGVASVLRNTLRHRPEELSRPTLRQELIRFLHVMLEENEGEGRGN